MVGVWQPDETTELLRNLVSRRATVVQGMTRIKIAFTRCRMPT